MLNVAMSEAMIFANVARHDVLFLFNVPIAPRTRVVINEWAWPLIPVTLQAAWVILAVTILAMLGDRFRHVALAMATRDRIGFCLCVVLNWFPSASD